MRKSKKNITTTAPGQIDLLTGETVQEQQPTALELLAAAGECDLDVLDDGKQYPAPTVAKGRKLRIWKEKKTVKKAAPEKQTPAPAVAQEKPKTKKQQEQEEKEQRKAELQKKIDEAMEAIKTELAPLGIEIFQVKNWLWFGDVFGCEKKHYFNKIMDKYGGANFASSKKCYCWHHPEDVRGVHCGKEVDFVDIVNKYGLKRIA